MTARMEGSPRGGAGTSNPKSSQRSGSVRKTDPVSYFDDHQSFSVRVCVFACLCVSHIFTVHQFSFSFSLSLTTFSAGVCACAFV